MPTFRQPSSLIRLAFFVAALALAPCAGAEEGGFVAVKLGISSMSKTDQAALWKRLDEYASVDALQEFCGRKLNLQRRTWAAVGSCVETPSLRKVAAVFRAKKGEYMKAWTTVYSEPDKKKVLCEGWSGKLREYARIIDTHIAEARTMCNVCVFC